MNLSSAPEELQQRILAMSFVLEALSLTREHDSFSRCAAGLCDHAASHFNGQASLGWVSGHYVRLRAVSGMSTPEKGTEMAVTHERAMEETLGAGREICLNRFHGNRDLLSRNHHRLAMAMASESLLSVPVTRPVRDGHETFGVCEPAGSQGSFEIVGVLMICRAEGPFQDQEILAARLLGMNLGSLLDSLYQRERWFGARVARWLGQKLNPGRLLKNPLATFGSLGCLALGAWLCFGTLEYRISAPFLIRARREAVVPALREGYVSKVQVQTGDSVSEGQPLVILDTLDLQIRRQESLADIQRFRDESSKALAENKLGDMEIASARQRQSEAQLESLDYQIRESSFVSPLDGVVLDDMKMSTRIGAPLSRGEEVMRVGALDDLLAELKVREQDFQFVKSGQLVELKFLGQPDRKYGFIVESISPAASQDQEGAFFLLRARVNDAQEKWWRPGMTGRGQISAGSRSPLWIATHRLVDWLALRVWLRTDS
ncbi:MAG: hypothetical protein CVV64_12595 [Candidatus Wallbacteria bacterium HGW-Wallbacteria-1]|jgi:hypothetical protein|uniref:Uncharacterized protein n=1 Tax=Candidatus Wallbacteria bacterium HGW-Wallbacteria-1 TaxID=2013854 RepID=A0A2N1PN28_9BACT|nr:MAG: hypothetical protein CVV64_12595 [Candidatus Wallbacteria bacterium HGW-Wallbacteria-1]